MYRYLLTYLLHNNGRLIRNPYILKLDPARRRLATRVIQPLCRDVIIAEFFSYPLLTYYTYLLIIIIMVYLNETNISLKLSLNIL